MSLLTLISKSIVIRYLDQAILSSCDVCWSGKRGSPTMSLPNINTLPFDPIFEIASYLGLEDVVHLSRTCKQLESVLVETLSRRTIEVRDSPQDLEG